MKLVCALFGALTCVGAASAHAASPGDDATRLGYLTAGELADRCHESATASITYCFSYVAAVRDTIRAYEIWLNQREFCEVGRLSQGELRQAFLAYVGAYPSNRSGQAASVIVVALKQTYPCANPTVPAPAPKPAARP
jgi:hypothetical protein